MGDPTSAPCAVKNPLSAFFPFSWSKEESDRVRHNKPAAEGAAPCYATKGLTLTHVVERLKGNPQLNRISAMLGMDAKDLLPQATKPAATQDVKTASMTEMAADKTNPGDDANSILYGGMIMGLVATSYFLWESVQLSMDTADLTNRQLEEMRRQEELARSALRHQRESHRHSSHVRHSALEQLPPDYVIDHQALRAAFRASDHESRYEALQLESVHTLQELRVRLGGPIMEQALHAAMREQPRMTPAELAPIVVAKSVLSMVNRNELVLINEADFLRAERHARRTPTRSSGRRARHTAEGRRREIEKEIAQRRLIRRAY